MLQIDFTKEIFRIILNMVKVPNIYRMAFIKEHILIINQKVKEHFIGIIQRKYTKDNF
jgi:hypothetical protein